MRAGCGGEGSDDPRGPRSAPPPPITLATHEAGMAIANETLRAGQQALHKKNVRRVGLAVSAFFIIITVIAVWLFIRRLEADGSGYLEPSK